MSWSNDLKKIRRLLRDPNGKIWTDTFLLNLFNDVQRDFQHKCMVLEDFAVQRVPGVYHFSYMHGWEYEHLPSKYSMFYHCLTQHDDTVICHRWEAQHNAGIDADVTDYGVHWTQPWEAFMGQTPGEVVVMEFPKNLRSLRYIAYDEEPLTAISRKAVTRADASYITTSGEPIGYYEVDDTDSGYVLYPKPSVSFVDEADGNDGPAWYIEDDTEDVTTGTIGVRIGSTDTDLMGVPYDITDTTSNVFMVYDVEPTELTQAHDDGDYPEFLKKYIRYGVVSRAYGANTDGRIGSLAEYWQMRYLMGIRNVKKYRGNIRQDRDYRLTIKGSHVGRQRRHPRLPSAYPAVNP